MAQWLLLLPLYLLEMPLLNCGSTAREYPIIYRSFLSSLSFSNTRQVNTLSLDAAAAKQNQKWKKKVLAVCVSMSHFLKRNDPNFRQHNNRSLPLIALSRFQNKNSVHAARSAIWMLMKWKVQNDFCIKLWNSLENWSRNSRVFSRTIK